MTEQAPLPTFDLLVLGTVAALGEGATGKAIRTEAAAARGQTTTYQMIYDALRRLRQGGLVRVEETVTPLRYSITDAGQHALAGELLGESE